MNYVCQTAMILQLLTEKGDAPTVQPSALVAVPLFHVTGEVPLFLQSFAMGRKLVLMPKWDQPRPCACWQTNRSPISLAFP